MGERMAGLLAVRTCGDETAGARVLRATTAPAATGRMGWPVALAIAPTGGPNDPPRATAACGPPSGCAEVTTPAVACMGTAARAMGCVKCCSETATHAGCRYPK